MSKELGKVYKNYVNVDFNTDFCGKSRFQTFSRKLKTAFKKDCASAGLMIERWNKGYFDVWIYLKNPVTNKMCCLIVGDMRHLVGLPERPLEAVCYRRVEHLDDYKVSNRHARLDDVVERVLEICA